jgi:hypothetical protein
VLLLRRNSTFCTSRRLTQALDQARRKLKEEKQRFQAEEAAKYDNVIETEKKRLGN